jgi:hypothetical protein
VTPDVHIRRLRLKVVQRGAPWLTRDDLKKAGDRMRRVILSDLDDILERVLAGRLGDERIDAVAVDLEFDAVQSGRAVRFGIPHVRAQLTTALARALGNTVADRERARAASRLGGTQASRADAPAEEALAAPAIILALLRDWHAEGCLAGRLALFAPVTIKRWREAVVRALEGRSPAPFSREASVQASLDPALIHPPNGVAARDFGSGPINEATRLAMLVALAAQWAPFRPPPSQLDALLADSSTPLNVLSESGGPPSWRHRARPPTERFEETSRDSPATQIALQATSERSQPLVDAQGAAAGAGAAAESFPSHASIEIALPFLMLGSLHRVGWLSAAAAVLAESSESQHALAFGYALALKALPPPERGWRRAPREIAAASLAAGLTGPPQGAGLAKAERALGEGFSALDAVIADALVRGHDRNVPLLLVAAPPGVALVDPQGMFPVALGPEWNDVMPAALAAGTPLLVDPSLPPAVGAEIDAAGLVFASPGMPTRGEPWDVIFGPGSWRGISNATAELRPAVSNAAARWAHSQGEAREMLSALGPGRPLAPGLEFGALDRTVTLAAAMALGDICWRLAAIDHDAWVEPEPRLGLERFGDLPATVIAAPGGIEVKLPLGPRARDLARAGLLADIDVVPWLGRRRLSFVVG